jgi:hypothetical protein
MPPHTINTHALEGPALPTQTTQVHTNTDNQSQISSCANQHTPTPEKTINSIPGEVNAKKANVKIAMLNINGASSPTVGLSLSGKWALINNTIYNEKITIFVL